MYVLSCVFSHHIDVALNLDLKSHYTNCYCTKIYVEFLKYVHTFLKADILVYTVTLTSHDTHTPTGVRILGIKTGAGTC